MKQLVKDANKTLKQIKSLAHENGYQATMGFVEKSTAGMASGHVYINYHDQAVIGYSADIWYNLPRICENGVYIDAPHFFSDGIIEDWPAFLAAYNSVEKLRKKIDSYLNSVGERLPGNEGWKLNTPKAQKK